MTARPPKTTFVILRFPAWLINKSGFLNRVACSIFRKSVRLGKPEESGMQKGEAMLKKFGVLFVVLVVLIIAATAYAFAASNTVPATKAGAGIGVVSGYTVSGIVYNLDTSDATQLTSVEFDLDAAATSARIKLVAAGTTWYSCTNVVNHWTCAVSPTIDFSTVDELNVIAADTAIPTPTP